MGRRTPGGADHGPRDVQPALRAGDTDVRQAALLLELGLVAERAGVREDAVLEPGEEHHRELQPLRGVQGHQSDHTGVLALGRVGDLVAVGDEGDAFEEVRRARAPRCRRPRRRGRRTGRPPGRRRTPGPRPPARRGSPPGWRPAGRRTPPARRGSRCARARTRRSRRPAPPRRPSTGAPATRPTKPWIARRDRVASPGASSARVSASQKVIRSRSASAWTQASARSPMPRAGC